MRIMKATAAEERKAIVDWLLDEAAVEFVMRDERPLTKSVVAWLAEQIHHGAHIDPEAARQRSTSARNPDE